MASPCFPSIVDAGPYVFVSGRLPADTDAEAASDWIASIRQLFDGFSQALASVNLEPADIFKVGIWLSPQADGKAFDAAYGAFFGEHRPVRSMLGGGLIPDGALLEIEAICHRAA